MQIKRVNNNLSVRGRVEFANEASESLPSPFDSKNIELRFSLGSSTLKESV